MEVMTLGCIAMQLGIDLAHMRPLDGKISVFNSAVATFFSPSDPSSTRGMRRERIRSTPSWRGRGPRYDCAFVVEDDTKPGMKGMAVVRIKLLFTVDYDGEQYPCALVDWFDRVRRDPTTGMWIVRPAFTRGRRDKSVIHLDALMRAAHLIPVYGNQKMPLDFHYGYSLDAFEAYYVNKYIDHHANEIAF